MPLTKMEHYLVLTADIEATRDFYCRALGMQVGFRPPLEFPGYWLYVGDTPCIHIAEWQTYTAHSLRQGIPVPVSDAAAGRLARHAEVVVTGPTYHARGGGCC